MITRAYKRLQGVMGGHKGLQKVFRSYRVLQGLKMVTWGYKGLHRVARYYSGYNCYKGFYAVIKGY